MNSFILMAEVIEEPQLRYTSDSQVPIAEMRVRFDALREDDPAGELKVVGWRNLAQDMQEKYHVGDRVIIEGRLGMNTFDRQEGFKEKRAELTAQRIHKVSLDGMLSSVSASPSATPSPAPKAKSNPPRSEVSESAQPRSYSAPTTDLVDMDDIPF